MADVVMFEAALWNDTCGHCHRQVICCGFNSLLAFATYHQTNKNSRPSKPKRPVQYYLGIVILDNKYFGKNLLTNSATPFYLKTLSQDKGQQPNLPSTPHKAKLAELEENQSGSGSYLKVIEHFQPQNVIKL